MAKESWIAPVLDQFAPQDRERTLSVLPRSGGRFSIDGREYLNFSCNDYLDLQEMSAVLRGAAEALRRFGAGPVPHDW